MSDQEYYVEKLERLVVQAQLALDLVRRGPLRECPGEDHGLAEGEMAVGDFVVRDRFKVECQAYEWVSVDCA